jgi:hypothetical protein
LRADGPPPGCGDGAILSGRAIDSAPGGGIAHGVIRARSRMTLFCVSSPIPVRLSSSGSAAAFIVTKSPTVVRMNSRGAAEKRRGPNSL